MARTQRGTIDELGGYTILYLDSPTAPQDDYYEIGTAFGPATIWGVGIISFGAPTAEQQAWMANIATNSDLSTFPGDWVSFGYSTSQWNEIEIWTGGVWVEGALITPQSVSGNSWSMGGHTGTGTFYVSDLITIDGTIAGDALNGTASAETIHGSDGNDRIDGGAGADALYGDAGNDTLIGGDGVDRLFGGDGDDILAPGVNPVHFNSFNPTADSVVDGGAGQDILQLDYSAVNQSVSLSGAQLLSGPAITNVEALQLTGTQYVDVLSGTASDDRLYGGGGFDLLRGGNGNDLLDAGAPGVSSVGSLGEGGQSAAEAFSLDHLFTAGAGNPSVSFSFHSTPTAVINWGVDRQAGSYFSFTAQAGAEFVLNYEFPYGGSSTVLNFSLTDSSGNAVAGNIYDSSIPIIIPHDGVYILQLSFSDSNIWGMEYANFTVSLQGGDVLGRNVLSGGLGNDTYAVYSATDQVIEGANAGTDSVRSTVTYRLPGNVESLTLTGADAINAVGNALDNILTGNGAANVLNGLTGADIMRGGDGNDIYIADNSGDRAVETVTGGIDSVRSSVSLVLGSNVENLFLLGSAAINGTGNALANILVGNSAANVLNGGAGADTLKGGGGNDTYFVDNVGDRVFESAGAGADSVKSYVTYRLVANVESMVLLGTATINGTGNTLDNVLVGNSAANILVGGGGRDVLAGGGGRDQFLFRDGDFAGLTETTCDELRDFSHADGDKIRLDFVDANSANGSATNEAFAFIGTSAFNHVAGELRYEEINGNTYIFGDTDGDGVADFMVRADGSHAFVAGDFVL